MITRTWPYGTVKTVRIDLSNRAVIMGVEPETNEAFLLVWHGQKELPSVGENLKIIFCEGGPTGGYWKVKQ